MDLERGEAEGTERSRRRETAVRIFFFCERTTNKNKTKSNNNKTDEVDLLMLFMNGCDVIKKG